MERRYFRRDGGDPPDRGGSGRGGWDIARDIVNDRREMERERGRAIALNREADALQGRVDDLDARSGVLEDTRDALKSQLNRLVDDSYRHLSPNEQAVFDTRVRRYERSRLAFNHEVAGYNQRQVSVEQSVQHFNSRVEEHNNRLRDGNNEIQPFEAEDYPEQLRGLPALDEHLRALTPSRRN